MVEVCKGANINAESGGSTRVYSGTVQATDPDDAFYRLSQCYRDANVQKCYPAEG